MNGQYKPGDIVLGKWTLTRLIGQGSFGRVFEAAREDFGVTYRSAIKIITIPQSQSEVQSARSEGMDDASVTAYFRSFVEEMIREFELMAQLKGTTNIVSYEDHEVVPHDGGVGWDIFIRMELLTPLLTRIQNGRMEKAESLQLGIDMCRALELCQKYHIIHRDIKPENIFISENGDFKLGDFGIARTAEKTTGGLSKKGTYAYMAPEVYREQPYGPSADLYSLGLVLYRLFNGNRTPFLPPAPQPITHSAREQALARRIGGDPLPPPSDADEHLSAIILKACAYDPKGRYSSPSELRQALEEILKNQSKPETAAAEFTEKTDQVFQAPQEPSTPSQRASQGTRGKTVEPSHELGGSAPTHNRAEVSDEKTALLFQQDPPASTVQEPVDRTESVFHDAGPNTAARGNVPPQKASGQSAMEKRGKKGKPLALILGAVALVAIVVIVATLGRGGETPGNGDPGQGPSVTDPELNSTEVNPNYTNEDHLVVTYEAISDAFYVGENQVERSSLNDADTVVMDIQYGNYTTSSTREMFVDIVTGLKNRLDLLGVPYAFGYSGTDGENFAVRISPEVLGTPAMEVLTAYDDESDLDNSYCVIDSGRTLELRSIEDFSCQLNENRWEISLTLSPSDADALETYLADNPQGYLYLTSPGSVVFAHLSTSEITTPNSLIFTGIDCISSAENQTDYAFLMDLMTYIFHNPIEEYSVGLSVAGVYHEDYLSYETRDGSDNRLEDQAYGVQYVTAVDEQVYAAIQAVFPEVQVYRPNFTVNDGSQLYVSLREIDRPDGLEGEAAFRYNMDIVAQTYTLGNFDNGAYTYVTFLLSTGDVINFAKDETGTMRLSDATDTYMDLLIESDFYGPKLYPGLLKTYNQEGWAYDDAGRLTREVTYNDDGSMHHAEEWDYDDAGNQIAYRYYQGDGSLGYHEEYVYNSQGQVTEAYRYDSEGSLEMRAEYTYDADGTQHGTVYDAEGNVTRQF